MYLGAVELMLEKLALNRHPLNRLRHWVRPLDNLHILQTDA
jgi:hypothetical protein